jgi:ketosteroid isomerase-like protein
MSDLQTRLRRLEDREEMRALVGTYALCLDDRDFDGLGACFTQDAVFGPDDGSPGVQGRAAIIQLLRGVLAGAGLSVHVNHDSFVVMSPNDSDAATGLVLCHAETSHGGHRISAIRYRDHYRREDGVWRIASRRLRLVYSVAAGAYAGSLV